MNNGYIVNVARKNAADKRLAFVEGLCAADPNRPKNERLGYHLGIERIFNLGIVAGEIQTSGPYDDRKYRFNYDLAIDDQRIVVPLGVTHWNAIEADMKKSPEEIERLKEMGRNIHGDEFAFLSCAFGYAVAPITSDGKLVLGQSLTETSKRDFIGVEGFVKYRGEELNDLDLIRQVILKLSEEIGVSLDGIVAEPELMGIVTDPHPRPYASGMAILYLVRVAEDSSYFASGKWKENVEEPQHENLVLLTYDQIQQVLRTGTLSPSESEIPLQFTTAEILRNIRPDDLAS